MPGKKKSLLNAVPSQDCPKLKKVGLKSKWDAPLKDRPGVGLLGGKEGCVTPI